MVPVLFKVLVGKVVLTPIVSLKSGLDTFRILRHNGASMHQVSLHLPVSDIQLRPDCWDGALVEPL